MKINRTNLAKVEPPSKGRVVCWDDALPGFGVRISEKGTVAFILKYRVEGRQHQLTLGRYGPLTVEQARKEARKKLGEVAKGNDPMAEKRKAKSRNITLREAFDAYLNARKNLKESTIADMRKAFAWGLKDWMDKPLVRISPDMVKRRHNELGKRSHARANLAMRYLRAIYNFALANYTDTDGKRLLSFNPVTRLSDTRAWFKVERRRTVIKRHEIQPWFRAVLTLDNHIMRGYFILVLLTGLRKSEAIGLRWADIDFTERTLTVRDTKNHSDHTLPLSGYLASLLKNMERAGDYVFQSSKGRISNFRFVLEKVRKESGVVFTIHDLRRTFATVANTLDIPAYTVKALLNHKSDSDVTAGYIVTDVEGLRQPMQRITDFFLKQAGVMADSKVIPFAPRN